MASLIPTLLIPSQSALGRWLDSQLGTPCRAEGAGMLRNAKECASRPGQSNPSPTLRPRQEFFRPEAHTQRLPLAGLRALLPLGRGYEACPSTRFRPPLLTAFYTPARRS